jgi:S-DNA-T family DNA segregation ATPase FtsK/SpoIIIE
MTAKVSVSEVRNALRCPRLFALGRQLGREVSFPVGASGLGAAFHRLADRLAGGAAAPPAHFAALPADASPAAIEAGLRRWLLDLLIGELRTDPAYASMPSEVDDLAEALRQLASHLAALLGALPGPPAARLPALVVASEQAVEAEIEESGVVVSGRLDALYQTAEEGLCIVEYKLTDERGADLDQAQVALYRALLRRQSGVEARARVLRFGPALAITSLPDAQADSLVSRVLLPLLRSMSAWIEQPDNTPATERRDLCASCPVMQACAERYPTPLSARDQPPSRALHPRPDAAGALRSTPLPLPPLASTTDAAGQEEATALAARLVKEMSRLGVSVEILEKQVGARRIRLGVRSARGALAKLDKAAPEFLVQLGQQGGKYDKTPHSRGFSVPRHTSRPVPLGPLLTAERAWLTERSGRFVVGERLDGAPLLADLGHPATPHLLIGGQAGSGKSWLLRAIVAGLIQFHGPEAIRLTLVDPKRVSFSPAFRATIGAHLEGPLLYDAEDVLPLFEQLVEEMERRYTLFEVAGIEDLSDYNAAVDAPRRLPRHVILLDEFADLMVDKARTRGFVHAIDRLGAKARAAGIHLVLATQRPDKDTVPSALKANLGGKIALRVANQVNSRIILDQGGAEELLGQGDLLADLGLGIVRAQAAAAS